ncbi:hypothetical protein I2486_13780 [Cellulophaga sp. E16_2]|uniref:hypothetical protein n=1 Tax=Cellulophaga sp. E16_2 TaxID=2789297 RepID=UPI001A911415|nr:hypothetical protein [Cellulophaga sp. E16_2]MBO0592472.1 hypothetical protein [Cellulophaga sp. E16_2]
MENPFKKLDLPPKEVPKELKKKVMDDVKAFAFFSEVIGLFSSNYAAAAESFFKKRRPKKDLNQ